MRLRTWTLGMALLAAPAWLAADVLDSAPNGFTVKTILTIQAPPEQVYRQIFHVGEWWSSQHAFSHDAHNLSIEEKIGGCFCEKFPGGGGAKNMEVVAVTPGKSLVMHGTLGPLNSLAAAGSMQIQLSPAEGGTKLEVTYAVGGYLPAGLNTWAAAVDGVLKEQFTRFKNFVEHGDPAAAK